MASTATSTFIEHLYNTILQRNGETAEIDAWLSRASAGMSAAQMTQEFIALSEAQNVTAVLHLYDVYFNRAPESVGLAFWVAAFNSGASLSSIAESFGATGEFRARFAGTSNADYVEAMYANLFGRAGDVAGKAYWLQQLDSGVLDRPALALTFALSGEALSNTGAATRFAESYLVLRAAGNLEPDTSHVIALAAESLAVALTEKITAYAIDSTAPLAPTVGAVKSVTGVAPTTASVTAEANSTVVLFKWADANADGIVTAGELSSLGTATASGGTANFAGLSLADHDKLVATATDAATNTSAYSAATTVSITDSTAPLAPTLGAVKSVTGIAPTTASVTAEANSSVALFKWIDANADNIVAAGELSSLGTATAVGGTANFAGLTLADHDKLVATATDAATNTSAYSAATTVSIIDSIAPPAPVLGTVKSVTGIAPTTAAAAAEANSTVALYKWIDANSDSIITSGELSSLGTATARSGLAIFAGLTLADHDKLVATATDAATNTSVYSAVTTVSIIDSTAPPAPTVGAVKSVTGIAPTTASVSAEANSTVTLFKWIDANADNIITSGELSSLGTATASGGTANFSGLTLAHHDKLVATATDAATNTSAYSAATTVSIIDSTAPIAPTVHTVKSVTGIAPTTASVTGEASSTVALFKWTDANADGIVTAGELSSLGTATASGGTADFAGLMLADHDKLVASATDAASNTSAYSAATTVSIIDSTAPPAPSVGAVKSVTGIAPTAASVTAEAGSTVALFKWIDANTDSIITSGELSLLGTATASSGTANFSGLTLTHHDKLVATATDAATNTSAYSAATTVSITDSTAPSAPSVGAVNSVTGIAPTTASVTAEANSTVALYKWIDANTDSIVTAGELSLLGTATATGGTANFTGLTLAHHDKLVASATDAATNTSDYSAATTVSITDSTAPVAPTVGAVNSVTGIAPTTASVTAEANSTVALYKWIDANTDSIVTAGELSTLGTATATGGTANFSGLTLAHHDKLVATATDVATNTSAYSAATIVSITDTTAPTLASSSPADGNATFAIASNLTLTFSEAVAFGTGNIVLKASSGDTVVESFNVATGVGSAGGTATVSGTTVTINPFASLSSSTDYNVRVDATAVVDTASNAFAGIANATTLNFTTAAPAFDGTLRTTSVSDVAAANTYLLSGAVTLTLDLTDPLFRNHGSINLSNFGTDDFLHIKLQTSLFPVIAGWQKQGATAHVIGAKSNAYSSERYQTVPDGSRTLTLIRTVRLTAPIATYPAFTPRQISLKSWQTANYNLSARFFISGLQISTVGHITFI
ncbi:MAG: DUF4214 domain-containing protein [Pseudomonadota bacterium]